MIPQLLLLPSLLGAPAPSLVPPVPQDGSERGPRAPLVQHPDVKTPAQPLLAAHEKEVLTRPAGPVPGPQAPRPDPTQAAPQERAIPHIIDRIYVDQPAGADYWVRGRSYKARFGVDGVDYIPFLGSTAPRNYPVTLRLAGVSVGGDPLAFADGAQPLYSDGAVAFDRGTLTERYLLALESVEQTFVFTSPLAGELGLRVDVVTDLTPSVTDSGFAFGNDLGSVHISRAVAVDANGVRVPLSTTLQGQALVITVPASVTAAAAYPLTIDPIVTTFDIDTFSGNLTFPKTAYDPGTNSFLTAYNENFSSTDGDVYATRTDIAGNFQGAGYVDSTSDRWVSPDVGCVHSDDSMLVAATVDTGPGTARSIEGRIWTPSTDVQSAVFNISGTFSGDKHGVSVGGDPFDDYLVVWERDWPFAPFDHDIHAQLVSSSGTLVGGTITIDGTLADDRDLDCSKFNGATPASSSSWAIVWRRDNAGTGEVWGAEVLYDGTITQPSYMIYNGFQSASFPYVSSPLDKVGDRTYLVTCNIDFGTDVDILASAVQGGAVLSSNNLSTGDLPGSFLDDEFNPRTDGNGMRFAVVWNDGVIGNFASNHVSTVNLVGGQLCVTETSTLNTSGDWWPTDIAAEADPTGDPDYMVVMYDSTLANGNITGAHYNDYWGCVGLEYCSGSVQTNSTGLWAQIYGLGSGVAGDNLTLYAQRLPANQFGYFLVSRTTGLVSPPGSQGTLCLGGSIGRYNLMVQNSGADGRIGVNVNTTSIPLNPPVAALPGETFYYSAWYRDLNPGTTSNFTDGLIVTFL